MLRGLSLSAAVGGLLVLMFAASAWGASHSHPQSGLYKSTSISESSFEFRVGIAVCPPDRRGGNQHKKKGYCFQPLSSPSPSTPCPGGMTYNDEIYSLFDTLIPASGPIKLPLYSSSGATGEFHITIGKHGSASGYIEMTTLHTLTPESQTTEKCPSGRITFTAKRV